VLGNIEFLGQIARQHPTLGRQPFRDQVLPFPGESFMSEH
jgi:hypothetical protein